MRFLTSMPRGAGAAGTAGGAARPPARVRALTWAAAIGIGAAMLIMIALSLLRDSWAYLPYHLRLIHDALARSVPVTWQHDLSIRVISPLVLLAAAAGLVALCLTGRWKLGEPDADASPHPACHRAAA